MARAASITLLLVLALLGGSFVLLDADTLEAIAYRFDPKPGKALALAQMHFDSGRPELYDIEKAERYIEEAYALDAQYLHVNHERARIEFLKGNFDEAMRYINREIELRGETFPNAFYIRGLIEGYMGEYHAAALDYAVYLEHDPHNWAALNDYGWVLIKAQRSEDALVIIEEALSRFSNNPWLLNLHAVVLYEKGDYERAIVESLKASSALAHLDESDWLRAYPGNDPRVASEGMQALKDAIERNMHRATEAYAIVAL